MPSRAILSHSRSAAREGLFVLVGITATMVGLAVFYRVFAKDASPWFYYTFHGIGLVIWIAVVFGYAVPNLSLRRRFEFTLFEDRIECRSPARAYCEPFSIALADLIALEEETGHEGANSWYLITRDDRRLLIPPHYGNPVRKIVAELRELRPGLEVERT